MTDLSTPKSYVHTLETAKETFDNAVANNVTRFHMTTSAAVRKALPFGEKIANQIVVPSQAAAFRDYLRQQAAGSAQPARERRVAAPAAITLTQVKARLTGSTQVYSVVRALIGQRSLWAASDVEAINGEIRSAVESAKRQDFIANGVVMNVEAIDRAATEAAQFIAGLLPPVREVRKPFPQRRGPGFTGGAPRPQGNNAEVRRTTELPKACAPKQALPEDKAARRELQELQAAEKKAARILRAEERAKNAKSATYGQQQNFQAKNVTPAVPTKKKKGR